ncbi:MAG: AbrB/MazE/SpoVT family DNA-binding domain-containing protein [Deltaproteobacteria bacterium]|nr:AbrB/MazE/SpoVT family DNA-binding domain-containing protein [Deltaproteobacteria bacterium]
MKKKLIKIGNSYGLTLEKPVLELLKITPKTELEVMTDGQRLIIEPAHKFKEAVKKISQNQMNCMKKQWL